MKLSRKIISVILCVAMVFTMSAVAITAYAKDDVTPVVFIPGIGQSQTYKYDDDGNEVASWNMLHVNTDFASFSIFDWVKMLRLVAGLVTTIIVQRDVVSESAVKGALESFVDHLRNDDGTFVNNVVTPNYPCPISGYNEDARSIFDRRIPCQALVDEIGEDNVYCYNYSIFSNTFENAEGLNDYIEDVVLPQTGSDKVILVPMSMGASVVNNYLNLYPDSGRIEKIISVVGAWQGSDVFADLMLADFDENAPDMVYTDAIQQIGVDAMTGSLINIAVRILPKQEVDNLLYDIISAFVKTLIVPNTSLISLCPPDRYESSQTDIFRARSLPQQRLRRIAMQRRSVSLRKDLSISRRSTAPSFTSSPATTSASAEAAEISDSSSSLKLRIQQIPMRLSRFLRPLRVRHMFLPVQPSATNTSPIRPIMFRQTAR